MYHFLSFIVVKLCDSRCNWMKSLARIAWSLTTIFIESIGSQLLRIVTDKVTFEWEAYRAIQSIARFSSMIRSDAFSVSLSRLRLKRLPMCFFSQESENCDHSMQQRAFAGHRSPEISWLISRNRFFFATVLRFRTSSTQIREIIYRKKLRPQSKTKTFRLERAVREKRECEQNW